MSDSEKRWRHVNAIWNEAHKNRVLFEHAPENVVVAIQALRTAVGKMSESRCPGIDGLLQDFRAGIRVAEAHANSEFAGFANRRDCAGAFRRERQQNRQRTSNVAELFDLLRMRVAHHSGVVRTPVARLRGKERTFDVHTGDGRCELV